MGFFRNIFRSRTLANGTTPLLVFSGGKIQTEATVDVNKAFKNSDVFAVIERISSDIASCSFNAQQYQSLMNNPFKLMNPYSGWQSVLIQLLLNGNAYVVLHRNGQHLITQLEPVPSDDVELTLTDNATDIIYKVHYTRSEEHTSELQSQR